jgi:tRNA/tmRNA/rRNA uracil-C5-methylase (TrmA/RlmC/RlmD family)
MQFLETFYEKNLQTKTQWMIGLLGGIGRPHLCAEIIHSSLSQGFRNRAKFRVFHGEGGMRVEGTNPGCGPVAFEKSLWILPDWGRQAVRHLIAFIRKNRKDFVCDGFEIQLAHGLKEVHTTFSVNRSISERYDDFAAELLTTVPEIVGVAIPSQKLEVGETILVHTIGRKDFYVHYASFFQSNLYLTPELIAHVSRISRELDRQEMLDLFCGVGLLSLSIGERDTKIVGVDTNRMAVSSARNNAAHMGFRSAKFFVSSTEQFIKTAEIGENTLVLINPPRSGCAPAVINGIASQNPEYIILVSCSLKTHVHDLMEWEKKGYEILSLKAFDMFPFTEFLETVTELKIKR